MNSLYGSLYQHDPLAAAVALMDPTAAAAAAAAAAASATNGKDTTLTKIFVGGLPYHTTDKTLREYFEQFGDIDEAVVITDRQTAKSRGYGFVTMKDKASADRACKDPNPIIDGRKANVNLAYLGAKPRNNLQLAGLQVPLQASIPALLPGRYGLPQLYYSTAPLLTSQGLVPVTQLAPSAAATLAANHYLDYATAAAAAAYGAGGSPVAGNAATPTAGQLQQAGAGTGAPANAFEPLAYAAAAYGVLPSASTAAYGSPFGAQGFTAAQAVAAYQAAAAAAAAAGGGVDRQC